MPPGLAFDPPVFSCFITAAPSHLISFTLPRAVGLKSSHSPQQGHAHPIAAILTTYVVVHYISENIQVKRKPNQVQISSISANIGIVSNTL